MGRLSADDIHRAQTPTRTHTRAQQHPDLLTTVINVPVYLLSGTSSCNYWKSKVLSFSVWTRFPSAARDQFSAARLVLTLTKRHWLSFTGGHSISIRGTSFPLRLVFHYLLLDRVSDPPGSCTLALCLHPLGFNFMLKLMFCHTHCKPDIGTKKVPLVTSYTAYNEWGHRLLFGKSWQNLKSCSPTEIVGYLINVSHAGSPIYRSTSNTFGRIWFHRSSTMPLSSHPH